MISDDSELGRDFVKQLKQEGSKSSVCVGAEHYDTGSGFQAIKDAILTNMAAKVIILNLEPGRVEDFLTQLNTTSNAGDFMVFSARALSVLPSFVTFTRSIRTPVYSTETETSSTPSYFSYLSNLRADTAQSNPWFNQWYEKVFNCSLDQNNPRGFAGVCANTDTTPITNSALFAPNLWYTNVVNSVRLAVSALHRALQETCGEDYTGACAAFWEDAARDAFRRNLRTATYRDERDNEMHILNGQGTEIKERRQLG